MSPKVAFMGKPLSDFFFYYIPPPASPVSLTLVSKKNHPVETGRRC